MNLVYKYCDSYGVNILRDRELKITPPNEFNDPFEFTPHVICTSVSRRFGQALMNETLIDQIYEDHKNLVSYQGDMAFLKDELQRYTPQLVEMIRPHMAEVNTHLQNTCLDHYSASHGVLCLSSTVESILMWGHYADKHQGIVIALDRDWNVFCKRDLLRPVNYVQNRVVWDTCITPGSIEEARFNEELVYSKNGEWAYEQELRQLFTLQGMPTRILDNDKRGYFLPIPPEIIRGVYLGVKCSSGRESEIRSILGQPEFAHVTVSRMTLHPSEFKMEIA